MLGRDRADGLVLLAVGIAVLAVFLMRPVTVGAVLGVVAALMAALAALEVLRRPQVGDPGAALDPEPNRATVAE